jgi:hypothetical protein
VLIQKISLKVRIEGEGIGSKILQNLGLGKKKSQGISSASFFFYSIGFVIGTMRPANPFISEGMMVFQFSSSDADFPGRIPLAGALALAKTFGSLRHFSDFHRSLLKKR